MAVKRRVLLLCGGQSEEHEVSLSSARSVLAAVGDRLELTLQVIDRQGELLPAAEAKALLGVTHTLAAPSTGATRLPSLVNRQAEAVDVVFPLLHGPYGEDGSVQGLLKLMNVPQVGSGIAGSAVGMDKLLMKAVFAARGLPQLPYCAVTRRRWQTAPQAVIAELADLAYPRFVKPANLGSSIGISKVENPVALPDALEEAARYDRRIVVEEGVVARELEVAVLGNDEAEASPVGEICHHNNFYDYHTKYSQGQARLQIPADIPAHIQAQAQDLALQAFAAIDAAGLARVDFFYREASEHLPEALFINEINTMPGFTATSMYPKLWQAAGLSYADLIMRLVELALEPR